MVYLDKKFLLLINLFLGFLACADISRLKITEGFEIQEFVNEIDDARQMVEGEKYIFVGTKRAGNLYAIDKNNSNKFSVILSGLDMPTGVAIKDGDLYIAETDTIHIAKDIEKKLALDEQITTEVFFSDLPRKTMWNTVKKSWHGWKWIDFGPDGALYISEGVPCNVCDEDDPRYGTILKLLDNNLSIYADGVRNSVGFDWHPETKEMYFTDNGRDWMGDDIPPCELNRVVNAGDHFGFPFIHGKNIADSGYEAPEDFVFSKPVWEFQAHTAPLGIKFYNGATFPEYYKNGAFVAQHGSWNRSEKVGYQILFMKMEKGNVISADVFIDGWMSDETSWGRPVTPLILKDGSMLISDDQANSIIRITYKG